MAKANPVKLEYEFDRIMDGVAKFGSALGAMDHGGPVFELEEEGHELIRTAFERAPELHELLPRLSEKLNAGVSVADDGFDIRDEVNAAKLRIAQRAQASCYCLEASREPYPWSFDKYVRVSERQDESSHHRIDTIRCKACGRVYEVEEDDTPATHTICTWRKI